MPGDVGADPTVCQDCNQLIVVLNRGRFLKSCEEAEARDAAKMAAAEPATGAP